MSAGERLVYVTDGLDGERLDAAIAAMFGVSRTGAAELIGKGKVLIDGKVGIKSDRVLAGAELSVTLPPPPGTEAPARPSRWPGWGSFTRTTTSSWWTSRAASRRTRRPAGPGRR